LKRGFEPGDSTLNNRRWLDGEVALVVKVVEIEDQVRELGCHFDADGPRRLMDSGYISAEI
jgi:hypothetical protein